MQRSGRTGLSAVGASRTVPLLSLPVFRPVGLSGDGGFFLALSRRYLSAFPSSPLASFSFLLPGLSAGCAAGLGSWLLSLASPSLWRPSFVFRVGCRRVWLLVAVGVCGVALRFVGAALMIIYRLEID